MKGSRTGGRSCTEPLVTTIAEALRAAERGSRRRPDGWRVKIAGLRGVHQKQVHVPAHAQVLEGVVEEEDVAALTRQRRRLFPPLAHGHWDSGEVAGEEDRFLSHLFGQVLSGPTRRAPVERRP